MAQVIIVKDCFYDAIMDVCTVLGRKLDKKANQELLIIILAGNGFPGEKINQLENLLASIGPLQVMTDCDASIRHGSPGIFVYRTGHDDNGRQMAHAEFGYANRKLLELDMILVVLFK